MAIPIFCSKCDQIVGTTRHIQVARVQGDMIGDTCTGRHERVERQEERKFFKLLLRVSQTYPDTHSTSVWDEYVGPKNMLILWVAVYFGTHEKRATVNGEWVFWSPNFLSPNFGLIGKGLAEIR